MSSCRATNAKVSKYDPDGRQHSANWDIPREVDRKIRAAMRALDALREACAENRVRVDDARTEVKL